MQVREQTTSLDWWAKGFDKILEILYLCINRRSEDLHEFTIYTSYMVINLILLRGYVRAVQNCNCWVVYMCNLQLGLYLSIFASLSSLLLYNSLSRKLLIRCIF